MWHDFGEVELIPSVVAFATSHRDKLASEIVALNGRRFTIEEIFRDLKNLRFGMGPSDSRIGDPARRDWLLLVSAIAIVLLAIVLLAILGAADEAIAIDKSLKANTVKRRTISLLRQDLMHYAALPKIKLDMLEPFMAKFGGMLRAQRVSRAVFGFI